MKGFQDKRWRNGNWDLNMFADKDGKMDWHALIKAEARRRKMLEVNPEPSLNEAPVLFNTSIIPWWAWFTASLQPIKELSNGGSTMVGFFMAYYIVEALRGVGMMGQTIHDMPMNLLFAILVILLLIPQTQKLGALQKWSRMPYKKSQTKESE
ncbi:light-harvesting complex-like protein 3 isotype 1, chloroplastic [Amborella trichopoda]|nr:light-harvesting complex-like protein 3 isotype 1, chloroplastic [Amborella trichopoda]|eukprot:XP_006833079.2 light-harvesting complex-like protein 3 isotype 1, chloroplastic [Amborella trichopoda]